MRIKALFGCWPVVALLCASPACSDDAGDADPDSGVPVDANTNSAPTIAVGDLCIAKDATTTLPIFVGDAESELSALTVTATSGDESLIPNDSILLTPNSSVWLLTLTPAQGAASGTVAITLAVSDGKMSASATVDVSFGFCTPGYGQCKGPDMPDDTECDDGDPCTENDACQGGVCVGQPLCPDVDQCHPGVCNPDTLECSNPVAVGAGCSDGDACTYGDTCSEAGDCEGSPVYCSTPYTSCDTLLGCI